MSLVLEKLSLTLKNMVLFKQLTKIISKKKILIQGVLTFSKKLNTSLKTIKLVLSIFLENSKIFLKNQDLKQINHFIYVEIYLFQI
ncbi:putative phage integrase (plasmid) [Borreliella valaisiana VS116]|uniref:Putative phage integrase n=1 Tax=Borreliella valaisiana VS116 TaxID=445987 RepID=C0R8F3_BORVA|nr:putative phage integrase [Borreliella valaisiana VS116]